MAGADLIIVRDEGNVASNIRRLRLSIFFADVAAFLITMG